MTKNQKPLHPQVFKEPKTLYDMGFFGSQGRGEISSRLEPLKANKYRPLILSDPATTLRLDDGQILLARRFTAVVAQDNIFCAWKEKDADGTEIYCLGIMDEQVTIAGAFYQCRKHPDKHRTLK